MTARYVGNGAGEWRRSLTIDRYAYKYVPSTDDRVMARDVAEGIAEARGRENGDRTGWGPNEVKARWYMTGFLGEVAALHPIGSGPDVGIWEGSGWQGRPDYGSRLEVRTTSQWQLYGFAIARHAKQPGLGGWRITRKDRGRIIVCVEDRGSDLMVLGWVEADEIPRLATPLGAVLAVIEPPDLRPLVELDIYAGRAL